MPLPIPEADVIAILVNVFHIDRATLTNIESPTFPGRLFGQHLLTVDQAPALVNELYSRSVLQGHELSYAARLIVTHISTWPNKSIPLTAACMHFLPYEIDPNFEPIKNFHPLFD